LLITQLHQSGENVCIVGDTNTFSIAKVLAEASYAVVAETVLTIMTPREMHGNEPPPVVASAMLGADVILAPTTYAITHTKARLDASKQGAHNYPRGIAGFHDSWSNACNYDEYLQTKLQQCWVKPKR
jgi:leucyl aminopeptidase (aminopeptidase T)